MKSMQLNRYARQFRACSVAALVLVGFSSVGAIAGNVHSGSPDVNRVFGQSSAMPAQGAPTRTAGLSVEAFGRSSQWSKQGMSSNIATRSAEGLIAEYGRGTPDQKISQKSPGKLAAKTR
jgi:hypothetical protein